MSQKHKFAADLIARLQGLQVDSAMNGEQIILNLMEQYGLEYIEPTESCDDWIQTFLGHQFFPLAPRAEDVDIQDIAHGLAQIPRFNGQARFHYSVAQHSVIMSYHCEEPFQALMHDSPESYLIDLPRPVKKKMPAYGRAEAAVWAVIAPKYGLPLELAPCVKEADQRMLITEKRDIMSRCEHSWTLESVYKPYENVRITPWDYRFAEMQFLHRFNELYKP